MASKIWWGCLERSSLAAVILHVIAREQLHNTQQSLAQPWHHAVHPHPSPPAVCWRQEAHGEVGAAPEWLSGFSCPLHGMSLSSSLLDQTGFAGKPACAAWKQGEAWCDVVQRFQQDMLEDATGPFFQATILQMFSADKSQHSYQKDESLLLTPPYPSSLILPSIPPPVFRKRLLVCRIWTGKLIHVKTNLLNYYYFFLLGLF